MLLFSCGHSEVGGGDAAGCDSGVAAGGRDRCQSGDDSNGLVIELFKGLQSK